jgi:cytochrome c
MNISIYASIAAILLLAAPPALAADAGLAQGLSPLAARQHCDECHALKEARIGPPFVAVAARYATDPDAAVNRLALKIINGGAGNWGTIPMIANERISVEDSRTIARWILALGHPASATKARKRA